MTRNDQLSSFDLEVIFYTKLHGRRKALAFHKDFHKHDTNRYRKLTSILVKYENEQLSQKNDILKNSSLFGNNKALHMHKNFHRGDKNRARKLSNLIQKVHQGIYVNNSSLHEKPNKEVYTSPIGLPRTKKRHSAVKQQFDKTIQYTPVELSTEEIKHRMADLSPILRRRATDPLPCRMQRSPKKDLIRYEDEDEEDCWDQILPGGRDEAAKLTLEDRLMLPASIRSNVLFMVLLAFITYVVRSLSSITRTFLFVHFQPIFVAVSTQEAGDR